MRCPECHSELVEPDGEEPLLPGDAGICIECLAVFVCDKNGQFIVPDNTVRRNNTNVCVAIAVADSVRTERAKLN